MTVDGSLGVPASEDEARIHVAEAEARLDDHVEVGLREGGMRDRVRVILDRGVDVFAVDRGMHEAARDAFLARFSAANTETLLGFAVMGGIFGEGIDLVGERLLGAIIVGVGLPHLSLERDLLKAYFAEHDHNGFAYAYQYPGLNRVMQAAGRVIRTEQDRGVILLIDERLTQSRYTRLFPPEWRHFQVVRHHNGLAEKLLHFWQKHMR